MDKKRPIRFGIYKQLIISYILVELVILATLIPLYNMTVSNARSRQYNEELNRIRAAVAEFGGEIDSASTLMTLLSRNGDMQTIMSYPRNLSNIEQYKTVRQCKLLRIALLNWTSIADTYLVFARNEIVMHAERVWFSYDQFYGRWYEVQGTDKEQWTQDIQETIRRPFKGALGVETVYTMDTSTLRTVPQETLVFTIPFTEKPEAGTGIFLIPVANLTRLLGLETGDSLQLYSASGEALLRADGLAPGPGVEELRVDGQRLAQFTVQDDITGLTFVVTLPVSAIDSWVRSAYEKMFVYVIVAMVIGSLLSLALAWRQYQPVRQIGTTLQSAHGLQGRDYRNEYEYFLEAYQHVCQDNQKVSAALKASDENMHRWALEDLLFHRYKSDKELGRLTARVKLPGEFRVAIIHMGARMGTPTPDQVQSQAESSMSGVALLDAFTPLLTTPPLMHPLSGKQWLLVIPAQVEREQLARIMERIRSSLRKIRDLDEEELFMALSHSYQEAGQLWQAFGETRGVMAFRHHCQEAIVFIRDLESRNHPPVLTEESAALLKSFITQGDEDRALEFIESAFGSHFLGCGDYRQLFYSVRGCLVQLMEEAQVSGEAELLHYSAYMSHEEHTQGLLDSCSSLCKIFAERKTLVNQSLNRKILEYLEENYQNPNIYGKSIAAHFKLKEKNLYSFFKTLNHTSLSSYLERLRMDKAAEWLSTTDRGINEIAESVGFHSSNTFYKAFLRTYGTSPSDYRARNNQGG